MTASMIIGLALILAGLADLTAGLMVVVPRVPAGSTRLVLRLAVAVTGTIGICLGGALLGNWFGAG